MTKRVLLTGVMWCLTSVPSMACYLINTEGSGEFKTSGYWKEDGEIKFLLQNGVIGVSESEIQNISKMKGSQRDCRWATEFEDVGQQQIQASAVPGVKAQPPMTVGVAAASPGSEAYQQFQRSVASLEGEMRRLGTMSKQELFDLAKVAESLKKQLIDSHEGEALNPLLGKVSAGLEQIEAMITP